MANEWQAIQAMRNDKEAGDEPSKCSFCSRHRTETRFMYRGPRHAICGECIVSAVRTMAEGPAYFRGTFDHVEAIEHQE